MPDPPMAGTRSNKWFYDLSRSPPICPKCGILWSLGTPRASRLTREYIQGRG
jgi:hypothetical protein